METSAATIVTEEEDLLDQEEEQLNRQSMAPGEIDESLMSIDDPLTYYCKKTTSEDNK